MQYGQGKEAVFVDFRARISDQKTTVDKITNTKAFKEVTYYFCDAPSHRDKMKWHRHSADKCRTRKKWLEKQTESNKHDELSPTANVEDTNDTKDTDNGSSKDVTSMLASVLDLVSDNDVARDYVAEALNALHTSEW